MIITVVTSGLLFAGLLGLLLVWTGVDRSIQSFSKEGLHGRFVVATQVDQPNSAGAFLDPATIARAQQIFNQTVVQKKVAAKTLGVSYDAAADVSPVVTFASGANQQETKSLNPTAPAAQQAIREYAVAHPDPGIADLRQDAARYHPRAFYSTTTSTLSDGRLSFMQGNAENFTQDSRPTDTDTDVLQTNGLALTDTGLMQSFLFSGMVTPKARAANIPVVVTYAEATKLLGFAALPGNASSDQQLARIRELNTKARTAAFSACYRNTVSENQIQTAISQAADIAKNAGNKDYRKPTMIYGLPAADSCEQATVVSDTRTKAEKKSDANEVAFSAMFGSATDPVQRKYTFRIAGLMPDSSSSGSSTTIGDILKNAVGSSLNSALTIPSSMLDRVPDAADIKAQLFPTESTIFGFSPTSYFVEFTSAKDARNFINAKSCTTGPSGKCATTAKPFGLSAYGSNSIGVQDVHKKFSHIFAVSALAIVAVAMVIMGSTVGRMVADGRRETAVFRAIGAKRVDIALIYAIYTFCLSLCVALFALASGLLAAKIFDAHFWKSATAQAQLLFGATDMSRQFHLFAWPYAAGFLAVLPVFCGLLSMLLPLLRNVRRNPIRDMREE